LVNVTARLSPDFGEDLTEDPFEGLEEL